MMIESTRHVRDLRVTDYPDIDKPSAEYRDDGRRITINQLNFTAQQAEELARWILSCLGAA